MSGSDLLLLLDEAPPRPPRPSPRPQAPLPPLPPGSYDRMLPWVPPLTRDFLRADLWGVPVPGLPFVPRGSSEHPERFLTYFLYKYERRWQDAGLTAHAQRGYTHWYLSWPDARDDGGYSLAQFRDLCAYVRSWGFFVGVVLSAKPRSRGNDIDGDPADVPSIDRIRAVTPVLNALTPLVDEFMPAWELNLFNVPGEPTITFCRFVGDYAHRAGASCWLHFSTEVTSWFANGDPRGRYGFYDDLGADIDGLNYQGDSRWPVPLYQARLVDTLKQFGQQGNRHKMRAFETVASLEFSHDHPSEAEACLMNYLLCCTKDNVGRTDAKIWGYGNGGRLPSGDVL